MELSRGKYINGRLYVYYTNKRVTIGEICTGAAQSLILMKEKFTILLKLHLDLRCSDQYAVWVWKDGQVKAQGRKFLVSDKNTLTKLVDIEPCLNHHFL